MKEEHEYEKVLSNQQTEHYQTVINTKHLIEKSLNKEMQATEMKSEEKISKYN